MAKEKQNKETNEGNVPDIPYLQVDFEGLKIAVPIFDDKKRPEEILIDVLNIAKAMLDDKTFKDYYTIQKKKKMNDFLG